MSFHFIRCCLCCQCCHTFCPSDETLFCRNLIIDCGERLCWRRTRYLRGNEAYYDTVSLSFSLSVSLLSLSFSLSVSLLSLSFSPYASLSLFPSLMLCLWYFLSCSLCHLCLPFPLSLFLSQLFALLLCYLVFLSCFLNLNFYPLLFLSSVISFVVSWLHQSHTT